MTHEQTVHAALQQLKGTDLQLSPDMRLKDDLGLDSAQLVELTVIVHGLCGVDLGRRSAERKLLPTTVADVVSLLEAS